MKRIIALVLMALFTGGSSCTLGVPIIDGGPAHDHGNAGGDSDDDRNHPPERERPPSDGEGEEPR